jgi:hypothetical protein
VWIDLTPNRLAQGGTLEVLLRFATDLSAIVNNEDELEIYLEIARRRCLQHVEEFSPKWRLALIAAVNLFTDLVAQGWSLRVRERAIYGRRPSDELDGGDSRSSKRQRLLVRRNEQLRETATREFVRELEAGRYTSRGRVSIFSLMRDGRELASRLEQIATITNCQDELAKVIDPYIQFVSPGSVCAQTGFSLQDIWRYFRHTWSNPYESVPGRGLLFLVRDRATPFHSVIGIAALSSGAVQLEPRDLYIGWHAEKLLSAITAEPTEEFADWVLTTVERAIAQIYIVDFVKAGIVPSRLPANVDGKVIRKLRLVAQKSRDAHRLRSASSEHKKNIPPEQRSDEDWEQEANSDLFRAKRALELAGLQELRSVVLSSYKGCLGKERLIALLSNAAGRKAFLKLVKTARSMSVGTAIADLTVCGAIPPYNELLGGKLVAMLAASPEVVREYERRYSAVPSVIASSMTGKQVVRAADLVFIGTTSLYGVRPNQYDRITIPGEIFGQGATSVTYRALGERTEGVGTFQFSKRTKESLGRYYMLKHGGRRVNNVFGEGANPKLRALRDGLAELGFDADALLTHGLRKTIYGVNLVTNLREYLLGLAVKPRYRLPIDLADSQGKISRHWLSRWVQPRLQRTELSTRLRQHTLVHPVRHRARVSLPDSDLEQLLLPGIIGAV